MVDALASRSFELTSKRSPTSNGKSAFQNTLSTSIIIIVTHGTFSVVLRFFFLKSVYLSRSSQVKIQIVL